MIPLKIKTKYFTLEVYRRGIVFTIASLLIASGVNLVNGNIFGLLNLFEQASKVEPFEIPKITTSKSLLLIPDEVPDEIKQELVMTDTRKILKLEDEMKTNFEMFRKMKTNFLSINEKS